MRSQKVAARLGKQISSCCGQKDGSRGRPRRKMPNIVEAQAQSKTLREGRPRSQQERKDQ